jgi:hypothetical protein
MSDRSLSGIEWIKAIIGQVADLYKSEYLLLETPLVDLNTATNIGLYTVPTGFKCVITKVILKDPSISLTTWSGSFGFVTAAFTDVIANAAHTTLTGATIYEIVPAKVGSRIGSAAEVFTLKNNTLQGAAATCTIQVFGHMLPA